MLEGNEAHVYTNIERTWRSKQSRTDQCPSGDFMRRHKSATGGPS